MILPKAAKGPHALRHSADPLPQVEIVRTLVGQHATALAGPSRPPAARIVVALGAEPVVDDVNRALNRSQFTGFDERLQLLVLVARALVEHHAKDPVAFGRGFVHLANLARIDPGRLLAHCMQAIFERLDHQRRMEVVGSGDDYSVHALGRKQGVGPGERLHARAVFVLHVREPSWVYIGYGRELRTGDLALRKIGGVVATHAAKADNTNSHLVHIALLVVI